MNTVYLISIIFLLIVFFRFGFKNRLFYDIYLLEESFDNELDCVRLSKNILDSVIQKTKADSGVIYWLNESQQEYKLRTFTGLSAEDLSLVTRLLRVPEGILDRLNIDRAGFIIKNLKRGSQHTLTPLTELSGIFRSLIVVPLEKKGTVYGVLMLFKSKTSFNRRELALLNYFAPRMVLQLDSSRLYQMAKETAIENARLYVNLSKLYQQATLDELTGLYNRNFLMQRLKEEIKKAWRSKQPLSVIFGDLDHFKRINDEYGHQIGDHLLAEFGELLRNSIREHDLGCRFGGEEFVILLPRSSNDNAVQLAERIRAGVANHLFCSKTKKIKMTVSFGVSTLPRQAGDETPEGVNEEANLFVDTLVAWADEALYRAKKAGRNMVISYTDMEKP